MDNQDRNSGNLDPKLGRLKDQRGFVGTGGDGGDDGGGDDGDGGDSGTIDPSTIDFTKLDWSKANWKGEFTKDPSMEKHKDIYSVIKANKELEKFVGMDKLPMPAPLKEGATEKEKAQYNETMGKIYARLGRPEAADKYDIKAEYPEEAPLSDEVMGKIKEVAFAEGLTNKQLNSVISKYGEILTEQVQAFNEQKVKDAESAVTAIKKEWGTAFNERVAVSGKAYNAFVKSDKLKELFGGDKLGNDPEMLKFFYELGNTIGEDVIAGKAKSFTSTPEEVRHKIEEKRIKQATLKAGSVEERQLQKEIDDLIKVTQTE